MKERMKELAAKVGLPPGMGGHRASKRTFENTFAEQARCWTDAVAPPPICPNAHGNSVPHLNKSSPGALK
eukprot:1592406-Pyramimonas_sp.AAC.1